MSFFLPRLIMARPCSLGSSRCVDWIKFAIPTLTATIALVLCLFIIVDCKSSIHVSEEWLGLFSHMSDNDTCISYGKDPVSQISKSGQLLAAQVGSLLVVLLGFPLWLTLLSSPFWKHPYAVWPKIISIIASLVIGNLQLLTVVKFIRSVLASYPKEKVFYENKGVVTCSVFFWLLTAIAISLCGNTPLPSNHHMHHQGSNDPKKERSSKHLSKSASEDTKDTNDIGYGKPVLSASPSEETNDTKNIEEGLVEGYNSASEDSGGVEEAIELCLSASGEGTIASF